MLSWANAETPRERAYHAACCARMNVVYYQRLIKRLEHTDRWLRVISTLLSSAGVAGALKFAGPTWAIVAGAAGAIASATTLVWGFADKGRSAAAMLPRYVEHFHEFQKLFRDMDESKLKKELEAFAQTEMTEAEKVKDLNEKLLKQAHADTARELQPAA